MILRRNANAQKHSAYNCRQHFHVVNPPGLTVGTTETIRNKTQTQNAPCKPA
jgi:hypothetical protein